MSPSASLLLAPTASHPDALRILYPFPPTHRPQDFAKETNTIGQVQLPVSAVVNALPLLIQKFLDGGMPKVIETSLWELAIVFFAVLCYLDWLPGLSFFWKLAIGTFITCLSHQGLFFAFGNRNMVYSFLCSHETGKAAYIDTGRPTPYERRTLHELYYSFAQSHYEPAVALLTLATLILLLMRDVATFVRLSVFLVPIILWTLAPVVFTPNAKSIRDSYLINFLLTPNTGSDMLVCQRNRAVLKNDTADFYKPTDLDKDKKIDFSFTDTAALNEYKAFTSSGPGLKLLKLVVHTFGALLLWLATPGIIKAELAYFSIAWVFFVILTLAQFALMPRFLNFWQLCGLPICYGLIVLKTVGYEQLEGLDELTRMLWCAILQLALMQVAYDGVLLLAHLLATPQRDLKEAQYKAARKAVAIAKKDKEAADDVLTTKEAAQARALEALRSYKIWELFSLQLLHWVFLMQPMQWYAAALVLSFQRIVLIGCGILDKLGGLHAMYLFNQRPEHSTAKTFEQQPSERAWHSVPQGAHPSAAAAAPGSLNAGLQQAQDANAPATPPSRKKRPARSITPPHMRSPGSGQ